MSEGHRKPRPVRARRKKHWALRVLGWMMGLFFAAVIGAVGVFFLGYTATDIPDENKAFQTNTTIVFWNDGQTPLGTFYDQNRTTVPLEQIPKHMQDAAIAAEDRTFWTNPGVSPSGMTRAAWSIVRGEQLQGGSTITQQYVKILYLTQEQTFSRKFRELFIATKLSRSEDKASILEGYLNTIYFGEGAYGVSAAASAYFEQPNKQRQNLKDLTVPQAAYLATVLNNPSRFDPTDSKAAHALTLDRYRYVLDGMRQMGTITDAQYAEYGKALPQIKKRPKNNRFAGTNGFLLQMARDQLIKEGYSDEEIDGGGLRVTTTFDRNLQKAAVDAVSEEHPDDMVKEGSELHIGLASVRPETGELVAIYGGPNFLKSQINWATSRARPGSSFKPFAVAAALKDGKTLRDTFQGDSPIEIRGEEYNNEFSQDYGTVTLMKATEESINTAFYDLADSGMEDGPQKVAEAAEAAGIPQIPEADRDAPAIVLGPNAYASPLEMASAYGTFATNGVHRDWFVIKQVRDSTGKVLRTHPDQPARAFDEAVAADTTHALQQVVKNGTGRAQASKIGRPAAGKTGTAGGLSIEKRRANALCQAKKFKGCKVKEDGQDTLTSWWVGYTPHLSTAVLYRAGKEGESDLDPFSSNPAFFGGNWPARTWLAYMEPAHEALPEKEFPEPSRKGRVPTPDDRSPTRTPTGTPTQTPTRTPTRTPTQTATQTPTKTKPTKTPKPSTPTFPTLPTRPTTPPTRGP